MGTFLNQDPFGGSFFSTVPYYSEDLKWGPNFEQDLYGNVNV